MTFSRGSVACTHSNTCSLSAEEILLADDRDLNKLVSVKRIAPYRETEFVLPRKVSPLAADAA